jgi:hypothetical protein
MAKQVITIKKLIQELSKCKNQDAIVHIVLGDDDNDVFDTTQFEVFSDHSDSGYQDLFIHTDNVDFKREIRNPIE